MAMPLDDAVEHVIFRKRLRALTEKRNMEYFLTMMKFGSRNLAGGKKLSKMVPNELLEKGISTILKNGGEFAELYCERASSTSHKLDEDRIQACTKNLSIGVGLRLVVDGKTLYGYVDGLSDRDILHCADRLAGGIESKGAPGRVGPLPSSVSPGRRDLDNNPLREGVGDLLRKMNGASRAVSPKIKNVTITHFEKGQEVLMANSEGILRSDFRVYHIFWIDAVALEGSKQQTCHRGIDLVGDRGAPRSGRSHKHGKRRGRGGDSHVGGGSRAGRKHDCHYQ